MNDAYARIELFCCSEKILLNNNFTNVQSEWNEETTIENGNVK